MGEPEGAFEINWSNLLILDSQLITAFQFVTNVASGIIRAANTGKKGSVLLPYILKKAKVIASFPQPASHTQFSVFSFPHFVANFRGEVRTIIHGLSRKCCSHKRCWRVFSGQIANELNAFFIKVRNGQ